MLLAQCSDHQNMRSNEPTITPHFCLSLAGKFCSSKVSYSDVHILVMIDDVEANEKKFYFLFLP